MRIAHVLCLMIVAGSAAALSASHPEATDLVPLPSRLDVDFSAFETTPAKTLRKVGKLRVPTTIAPQLDSDSVQVPMSVLQKKPTAATSPPYEPTIPTLKAELRLLSGSGDPQTQETPPTAEVQFESDVPQVRVTTVGPDTLVVGKSARYVLSLANQSNFAARAVIVRCSIPAWLTLDSHDASNGSVQHEQSELVWAVDEVPARGKQELLLDLTARDGKAFELQVDVAIRPQQSGKRIVIKEPKLQVGFVGPSDVVYGTPSTWEIEVSNPGTGDAHDVVLEVFEGSRRLATCQIGLVPAKGNRTAALELTAFQAGNTALEARLSGSPGLQHSSITHFQVRRGELNLQLSGFTVDYAGTVGRYQAVLRNTGDAPLKNVLMSMSIPQAMKYSSGLDSPSITADGVTWVVPQISDGQELSFLIQLAINDGGRHELTVTASTVENQSVTATTVIEALTSADLRLEVVDPRGPRPLGTLDEFEIHVTNHGTDVARDVSIIALCAPTVEPMDVDGNAIIKAGQIFFKPVDLSPNHKVTYRVRVRAQQPGTHSFRVVVNCRHPELRLAAEESTCYFARTQQGLETEAIASGEGNGSAPKVRRPEILTERKTRSPDSQPLER